MESLITRNGFRLKVLDQNSVPTTRSCFSVSPVVTPAELRCVTGTIAYSSFMDYNYESCYGGYQHHYEYHYSRDDHFKIQESSDSKDLESSILTSIDQSEVRPDDSEEGATSTLQSLNDFYEKLEAKQ
ncbi:hypothetical protein L1987_29992 [Smallanthus sonchifolius]|uniref:Uncharacterized protein n=1 Tax=Smallanthus sonchifolius TaxID=185202 RepID=A0ACB9I3D2_9ASTR|nr:hypothetical protein L1987_29992 [Smallanthus sonchifolius]